MRSRRIFAFYAGQCRICGKALPKGTEIYFRKHYGMRCMTCGPHTKDDQRLLSKRKQARLRVRTTSKPHPPPSPRTGTGIPAMLCGDNVHRIEYGSVREIVEDALSDYAQTPGNLEYLRTLQANSFTGKNKWAHCFTRQKLLDHVFNPPSELLQAVARMKEGLSGMLALPQKPRRKLRRGLDDGDELSPDRWLQRDPYAWERIERQTERKRTLTIGCNLSVDCSIKPHELLYRGAACVALSDYLIEQGCNVGIAIFSTSSEISSQVKNSVIRCNLKAPDMPLDLSAVTFALCEIAFYRCALIVAGARRWPGKLDKRLGYAARLPAAECRGIDYLIDSDVLGEEAALNWLRRHLEPSHV